MIICMIPYNSSDTTFSPCSFLHWPDNTWLFYCFVALGFCAGLVFAALGYVIYKYIKQHSAQPMSLVSVLKSLQQIFEMLRTVCIASWGGCMSRQWHCLGYGVQPVGLPGLRWVNRNCLRTHIKTYTSRGTPLFLPPLLTYKNLH